MDIKKRLPIIFVLLSSMIFVTLAVKFTKSCDCLSSWLFPGITIDPTNDESKWALIRKFSLYLSIFVFAHSAFVMLSRIFTNKSSPATKEDPTYIKLFNRIITNTIEQSVIFLGLFTYFLIDGPAEKLESVVILNIAVWFIVGRVLFSLGYVFGTMLNFPQLRAYGFTLSIFVNVLLLEHIFAANPCVSTFFLTL